LTAIPPKAAEVKGAIEQVVLAPILAERYLCVDRAFGELDCAGDALGTDCMLMGGVGTGAYPKLYHTDGKSNADWYGWHANVLAPIDGTCAYTSTPGPENTPGHLGPPDKAGSIGTKTRDGVVVTLGHLAVVLVNVGDTVRVWASYRTCW
jgi:hypothetical protein